MFGPRSVRTAVVAWLMLPMLACGDTEAPGVSAAEVGAGPPTEDPRGPERIETETVTLAALRASISASGSIEARRVTEVAAEVGGRLLEVFVEVGDEVAEGDPLFRIDPGPYELAVAEVRAGLALARAEAKQARQEEERMMELARQDIVSRQLHEQLQTQAEVADARVAQMRARIDRAKRDLERTWVRSPYAGSVVERRAHEGALAGSTPIVVVQETGALEAVLDVPEATPIPVRVGDPILLFVEGRIDPLRTQVSRVNARVDAHTRTYQVRGPVDAADGTVKAGSYVRAELHPSRTEPRPALHRSAVLRRDGRTYVFRVNGSRAERVAVRVGIVAGDRAEILSGLSEGDTVVRGEAAGRLTDGMSIEPQNGARP